MTDLQIALEQYVYDQENALTNFNLAKIYDSLNQGAAAISFYLRASERTSDDNLAYDCQIRISLLFNVQGKRDRTVENTLKNAIAFKPDRPEAYYLYSRFLEHRGDYVTSYTMANLGLSVESDNQANSFIGYPGKYGLLFQKAVAAWWVGKPKESRVLFREILYNHRNELDAVHYESVQRNLIYLGTGPHWNAFRPYKKESHSKLRYQFPGSEKIEFGYGQVMQDIFILSALNGKTHGTYLEIGSCYAYHGNNTALLEKDFFWTGVGVEYDQKYVDEYRLHRKNPVIHQDALTIDYDEILSKYAVDGVIDYLQLDCDPPDITYAIMERIPFDKYKFAVITYEHDHHVDMTQSYRDKSRQFLKSKGYKLLVGNVSPDDISPFEDWWVHPELIDPNIMEMLEQTTNKINQIEDYMLTPYEKPTELNPLPPVTFELSKKAKPTVWVVDDFYQDPAMVREFAMQQEFMQGGIGRGFIGNRTYKQFLFPNLKEQFEKIMGVKIQRWEDHGMNGRFQTAVAGDPLVYHCDDQKYAGMIYLTPNAPWETGTTLWATKKYGTRNYYSPTWNEEFSDKKTYLDRTPYTPVDVIGNVYNRLVIFDASNIHSASEYFGHSIDDCRLWQMFFFD